VRKLPAKGVSSLKLVLRKGALRSSPALAAKRAKLKFSLHVTDARGHTFKLQRRVRARNK